MATEWKTVSPLAQMIIDEASSFYERTGQLTVLTFEQEMEIIRIARSKYEYGLLQLSSMQPE